MEEVGLQDASTSLSALIDEALAGECVVITRHGLKQAVIVSFGEYQRLTNMQTFGRLLAGFPGETGDIPERRRSCSRPLDL